MYLFDRIIQDSCCFVNESGRGAGNATLPGRVRPLCPGAEKRHPLHHEEHVCPRARAGVIVGLADSARFWAASGRTAREAHEALCALRRRDFAAPVRAGSPSESGQDAPEIPPWRDKMQARRLRYGGTGCRRYDELWPRLHGPAPLRKTEERVKLLRVGPACMVSTYL